VRVWVQMDWIEHCYDGAHHNNGSHATTSQFNLTEDVRTHPFSEEPL